MNFFMCHTQYYNLSSIKKRRYKRQKSVYLLFFLNIKKSTYEVHDTQLERVKRIELSQSAWKAEVLPLNYTRMAPQLGLEPRTP